MYVSFLVVFTRRFHDSFRSCADHFRKMTHNLFRFVDCFFLGSGRTVRYRAVVAA